MSRTRLADLPPLASGQIAVLAEYPYYRATPEAWRANLAVLRELGVQVITCYIPWRLHEIEAGRYDFDGITHPQRNLLGFLRIVEQAGLWAIVKPGPYINAEVRLGGLPDRVATFTPRLSAEGTPVSMEGLTLPSAFDPEFAAAAGEWLRAVSEQVIEATAYPAGPVIAAQIGNEGLFSELHNGLAFDDFSAPAIGAFGGAVADRQKWARWSGTGTRRVLTEWLDALGRSLPVALNLPLPGLPGEKRLPESWLVRSAAAVPAGVLAASTHWTGNSALSDEALTALWLGMRFPRTDALEDNWGFTWTDESYAGPEVPLYHALLALAFGSSTVAVYTACTTHDWAPGIGPDLEALRAEGKNPDHFAPPYCPGAPLDTSGKISPNAEALQLLCTFTQWFGEQLRAARPKPVAQLVVDPVTVAEFAWPAVGAAPLSVAAAAVMRWMITNGVEADVVEPRNIDPALTLVAVGGRAMSRQVQSQLAMAQRVLVVGPLPEVDEYGQPCALLTAARRLPVNADAVFAALAGDSTTDCGLLVVRGGAALHLFNRRDTEARFAEGVLSVTVPSRGAITLALDADGTLQGYLANRDGVAITVGDTGVPVPTTGGGVIGRRVTGGWETQVAIMRETVTR